MSKSLVYRLFGLGSLPRAMVPILDREGIALRDEGLSGSVTLRNFRSPSRRSSYRKSWFSGSLVITGQRFAGFAFRKPMINVPLDGEHLKKLGASLEKDSTIFCVAFDAADFHDGWTGSIECRFRTDKAREFLARLTA